MSEAIIPTIEAKISLGRLSHNLKQIRKAVGKGVEIMAVVKSNAYGHGLVPIAAYLYKEGVSRFAVARLEEALSLRASLKSVQILILSPILPDNFRAALKHNLTLTLTDKNELALLDRQAKKLRQVAKIHLKVDTGLNRSGVEPEEVLAFLGEAAGLKHLEIEGLFTHFANAGGDPTFTKKQLAVFKKVITDLTQEGLLPKIIHAAATSAIFKYKDSHFNLVRPGLALYGHSPDVDNYGLKPILSLSTRISRIHRVHRGETVGYNRTYTAKKDLLAATLYAGYADGLRRAPLSWPHVTINGKTAPIIGRMSMDQAVIDISLIKPKPTKLSRVILIANETSDSQSLATMAKKIGTSPYEVLTSQGERVTRTYIR